MKGGCVMLSIYPACFFKETDGSYSVVFPDLGFLSTCGETIDKATAMAVDSLAGYIYWLKKENEEIAPPSAVNEIDIDAIAKELDPDGPCEERFVSMVSVDVEAYAKDHFEKAVRKTLTIPAWLNTAALEQEINFSQTLQEALLAKVCRKG